MRTSVRNKTVSKTTDLRSQIPSPGQSCFLQTSKDHTTTLLPRGGGNGRIDTALMFRKMLWKCAVFSRVLSKIVALIYIWEHDLDKFQLRRGRTKAASQVGFTEVTYRYQYSSAMSPMKSAITSEYSTTLRKNFTICFSVIQMSFSEKNYVVRIGN